MTDQEPKNELVDMIMNERFVAAEELIRESLQTKIHESLIQRKEVVAENLAANIEEEKQDYESFFKSAMKKFGISSPADLKTDAKKKEFFDYVDKNFKGMKESYVNEGSYGMMRRGRVEGEQSNIPIPNPFNPGVPTIVPSIPNIPNPFDTPIYFPRVPGKRDPDGDGRPGTPAPPVEGEMPQMDPRMMQQMMQQMMMMQQQGGMGGMPPMMNPQKKKI
tara:strand:+ start:1398 stop:2054 length:657 start_codon:yes stop_codon:yes gene_type:complete